MSRNFIIFALLILSVLYPTVMAEGFSDEIRKIIETDWARQEQVARKLEPTAPASLSGALDRAYMMLSDMRSMGKSEATAKAEKVITEVGKWHEKMVQRKTVDPQAYLKQYNKLRWAVREMAFSNPLIDFDEIVFVKRQWPKLGHQCSHRVGEAQIPGANLCVLKGLSPGGKIRYLLDDERAKGGVGRFDLSYDGKRVVFPYAAPREKPTNYGYDVPKMRGGVCIMYDIYEIGIDGTGLHNLTNNPESEDTEPIYLPDGRIAFMTSRDGRLVQCGDWALVCGMYSMDAEGGDLRRITEPKEGEFYPNMLEDGRIMYTRWDYVMKGYNVIQQLWAVNPDGRRAALLYGDHYAFSIGPITFFEARQIPGTSKIICTGAAHHNTGTGPIMIVDFEQNRGTRKSMVNVTPEVGYSEINPRVLNEVCQDELPGREVLTGYSDEGWYSSPYPLSEKHYIAAASFERRCRVNNGFGIYLMDIHGNKELIYRLEDGSCYSPMPVRARKKPRVIADMVTGVDPKTPGTLIVTDIYQGLEGVKRGEVKYLRILETYSKVVNTNPQRCDVGVNSGWDMRGVLGTVPVEKDGSVYFNVPPYKQLFFEALDKDYLEIRRMRNYMNVMPGEVNSCIGCHEPYGTVPKAVKGRRPLATKRPPSEITPPPWGTAGLSYEKVVQPVLDKNCISCHDGNDGPNKSFTLKSEKMVPAPKGCDPDQGSQHLVSQSFLNLLKYVSYIRVGGYEGEKLPLGVRATGSGASRLMKILKNGHFNVKLDINQWRALAAWIDCNGPYLGSWDEIKIEN